MAKIEITGAPEELERIGTFLVNNNVNFRVVSDYGNHSLGDAQKFKDLIEKFK